MGQKFRNKRQHASLGFCFIRFRMKNRGNLEREVAENPTRCKVWWLLNPVCTGRDSSPASNDDALRVVEPHTAITADRWRNRKLFLIGLNWISINQARNFENIDSGVSQPTDMRRSPKRIKLLRFFKSLSSGAETISISLNTAELMK